MFVFGSFLGVKSHARASLGSLEVVQAAFVGELKSRWLVI